MELRHLRYFVAIAEAQSFRVAAERLRVSQPPLSRQMKDLEEEMGVELFEPAGRGITLTAAGKQFADRARAVLASVDRAVDEARAIAEGRLGTVVIGFETGTTFMGPLLSIVAAFRKRAPGIGLQLLPMSSSEQWAALRQRTIAFGYGAYAPSDQALAHLEMTRDRLGLLLARDHRLADRKKVRLRDLESERVVMLPRQLYPRLHADILTVAHDRGATLRVTAEVMDLEALMALVAIGDAVTFVGENIADMASQTAMVWRPVEGIHMNLSEFVCWRKDDAAKPSVSTLIECAREARGTAKARDTSGAMRSGRPSRGRS